jgi:cobalt transporter subunit CbtB
MREMNVTQSVSATKENTRVIAPIAAAALGLFILFVAGLAQPNILHNAAHDSRHAVAFPCH